MNCKDCFNMKKLPTTIEEIVYRCVEDRLLDKENYRKYFSDRPKHHMWERKECDKFDSMDEEG